MKESRKQAVGREFWVHKVGWSTGHVTVQHNDLEEVGRKCLLYEEGKRVSDRAG